MNLRNLKDTFYSRILRRRLKNFSSFGSHIPVLIGLGILTNPENVLELGAGLSSTPVFLNKSCYPGLRGFTSVENDPAWFDKLKSDPGFTGSSNLIYYSGRIADYIRENGNTSYDMILIDDSYETKDRVETINTVFKSPMSNTAVVLIHDFETREYQEAAREWPNSFAFVSLLPNVGVLWKNKNLISRETLASISKAIEKNKWRFSIYDLDKWVRVFNRIK